MASKTWEDSKGNQSSSRKIGAFVVVYASLCLGAILLMTAYTPDVNGKIALIASGGGLFTTMTGATFYFLYKQKETEIKQA